MAYSDYMKALSRLFLMCASYAFPVPFFSLLLYILVELLGVLVCPWKFFSDSSQVGVPRVADVISPSGYIFGESRDLQNGRRERRTQCGRIPA